jgi:uncharacterized lipoprotein
MKKIILVFSCFLLLLSCTSSLKKGQIQYGEVRTIEAPFNEVYIATRDFLLENGFPIIKSNYDTGELETDYKPGAGWTDRENENAAEKTKIEDRSSLHYRFRDRARTNVQKRARVKIKVAEINKNRSSFKIVIFSEIRDSESGWQLISNEYREAKLMYDRFFRNISQKAKRLN